MSKPEITFLAQFSPPITGLTKAVETLYNSRENKDFRFNKISISNNKAIISTIFSILKSDSDLYYLTLSQSKFGNLRDLLFLLLLFLKRKSYVVHLHGGYYRELIDTKVNKLQRKLNYSLIGKSRAAIVLGNSLRQNFEGIVEDGRIITVRNCVDDVYLMSDADFIRKLKSVPNSKTEHFVFLSNMIPSKGYKYVLALAAASKSMNKYHFDFAGKFFNSGDQQEFDQFIQQQGLEKNVTYHGIVTGDDKLNLLKIGKYFILPTRYPKEGQPISIIEAMGNGMIIISTDHAGIPDLVVNGVNGIVLKSAIAPKQLIAQTDTLDFQRIAIQNRREVKKNFTEERYVQEMLQVFRTSVAD